MPRLVPRGLASLFLQSKLVDLLKGGVLVQAPWLERNDRVLLSEEDVRVVQPVASTARVDLASGEAIVQLLVALGNGLRGTEGAEGGGESRSRLIRRD